MVVPVWLQGQVAVIASEAKQSMVPLAGTMDCFVASLLAMTPLYERRKYRFARRSASAAAASGVAASVATEANICIST